MLIKFIELDEEIHYLNQSYVEKNTFLFKIYSVISFGIVFLLKEFF
jgi:hypothetical protein